MANTRITKPAFRPGLTLLELVIAIGLFAILTLAVTRVFLNVSDVQQKIYQDQNLEGDLRYAVNVMIDEAQKAKVHPDDCGGCTGCTGKYFCTPSGDSTKVCLRSQDNTCVQYYFQSGQMIVQRGAQVYNITSSDVVIDQLQFKVAIVDPTESGNTLEILAKVRSKDTGGSNLVYQTAITNNP